MRSALSLLPWLVVIGAALAVSGPLWSAADSHLLLRVSGDGPKAWWFYEYVAQVVSGEARFWYLDGFDHPRPHPRGRHFPTIADAVAALPATLAFDGPRAWAGTQVLAALVNATGFAALARALGARHLGVVLAGVLGAWCLPAWYELYLGRANAAWPGLAGLALGAGSLILERVDGSWRQQILRRAPVALLAVPAFALGALAYPPYALLLAPAAAVLWPVQAWRSRPLQVVLLGLAAGGAVGIAWADLQLLWMHRPETTPTELEDCIRLERTMALADWAETRPRWESSRFLRYLPLGAWLLAPLGLLARPRAAALAMLLLGLLMVPLSLGNCPELQRGTALFAEGSPWSERAFAVWATWTGPIHDSGRFSVIACLLAAGLGGAGLERLAGPGRWRPGRVLLALGLGLAAAHSAVRVSTAELSRPHNWVPADTLAAGPILADIPAGAVLAELPMHGTEAFLAAALHPRHRRINPLWHGVTQPAVDPRTWLIRLGLEEETGEAPEAAAFGDCGVDWVLLDPGRCPTASPGCHLAMGAQLQAVLGEPTLLAASGVSAWRLSGAP